MRLESAYLVGDDGSTCVIQTHGEAADVAARIFAGLCAARAGELGFTVEIVSAATRAEAPAGRGK